MSISRIVFIKTPMIIGQTLVLIWTYFAMFHVVFQLYFFYDVYHHVKHYIPNNVWSKF